MSEASWQVVFRKGFMPQWSTESLQSVRALLLTDDVRIGQGFTTTPPPLMCHQDWPVEACDVVTYCSTPDAFDATVGECEEGFARACFNADKTVGEPVTCRLFLNWYDDTPRYQMFAELVAEIDAELRRRQPPQSENDVFRPEEKATLLSLWNRPDDWWAYLYLLTDRFREDGDNDAARLWLWMCRSGKRPFMSKSIVYTKDGWSPDYYWQYKDIPAAIKFIDPKEYGMADIIQPNSTPTAAMTTILNHWRLLTEEQKDEVERTTPDAGRLGNWSGVGTGT